ncbi:MAG: hypothetical protein A2Z14_13830 [Chloroflexi bacterium RBG_16_48_8]|nr:MAG: hypothetical protein A2Z14_13830 [Chloroflexi bacterium RBG_16_48_8]
MKHLKATDLHPVQSRSVALILLDAGLVFGVLLLIYSLTYSGSFRIDDEHILVARAQSLAFWDHIHYPQVYGNDRVRHLSTISEGVASPTVAIEPGQAFLGSLLYRFASMVAVGGVQAYFTMNLFATAITGALVYLSAHFFGYLRRTTIATALVYGLATMAWPYSKTAFRDPLATLMVAMTLLGWVILFKRSGRTRNAGFFIFLLGMIGALFFKSNVLVLLPSYFISSLLLAYNPKRSPRLDKNRIFIGLMPIILLTILSLLVSNPGPLSRFSISYYVESIKRYWENLNLQTLLAVMGPFFSPAKSMFFFNPLLLLIPWIVVRAWKEIKTIAFPSLLSAVLMVVLQALHLREHWAGTLVWGLRFILPILPMFSLLLAPWLEWLTSDGFHRKKALGWSFIALSALIQVSGAIVAWHIPFKAWVERGLDSYSLGSIWRFEYLAIPQHLRALTQVSSWDIAWIRTFQTQRWTVIIPILALLFISLAVVSLWKRRILHGLDRSRFALAILLFIFFVFFPIYPSLWLLRDDPSSGGGKSELQDVIDWAKAQVKEGDLVILDSYGTDLWQRMMNDWDEPVPWYSLPYEIPGTGEVGSEVGDDPSQAALDLFHQLGGEYSRLIYLTSQEAPDYVLKREEGWLRSNLSLEKEVEFKGSTLAEANIFSP